MVGSSIIQKKVKLAKMTTPCRSLSFIVIGCPSLSFIVTRFFSLYTHSTTCLSFYKRSFLLTKLIASINHMLNVKSYGFM